MYSYYFLGHIHTQDIQKDNLTKIGLQRTILNFYYVCYFMIIMDWYMTIIRMMSCEFNKKFKNRLDII